MPRFLNTWTGEFEWHTYPSEVIYAILSHVWREPSDGGEQSYDDVRRIQQEVKDDRWVPASLDSDIGVCSDTSMAWAPFAFISFDDIENEQYGTIFAHSGLSDKIKGFCKVAREAGFRLAWNDACCIDKTSSAELSEAINSMYKWYRLSEMCYVYLADVSEGVPQEIRRAFRSSRWHNRGWTLQELIAPEHVIFLTRTWNVLGTKMTLAGTLERITGVDFDILVGLTTLDSVSVARRMSWAAKRQTTRVEDRAYSLFGIFGLHMSPIYGEGENAFLRLQEEITRTIPDQSIFAWGERCSLRFLDEGGWSVERYGWLHTDEGHGLLTRSPSSFSECSDIISIASSCFAQTLGIQESQVPPVHCIFTPEGVSMRLICLPLSAVPDIQNTFRGSQAPRDTCAGCRLDRYDRLAVLQCQERRGTGTTSILGLLLCRSRRKGSGSNRCAFSIGGHIHDDDNDDDDSWYYRVVSIETGALKKLLEHVPPEAQDVTLLRHYSGHSIPKSLQQCGDPRQRLLHSLDFFCEVIRHPVFTISPHSMDALGTLGILPSPLQVTRSEQQIILETTLEFHSAGTTYVVALGLSLTLSKGREVKACFSAGRVGVIGSGSGQSCIGAAASHHAIVNTPHITGTFLNLKNEGYVASFMNVNPQNVITPTILSAEFEVGSNAIWGGSDRLLRIALQYPFATPSTEYPRPSHLWLSIDMSEESPYATQEILQCSPSKQTGTKHKTSNKDKNVSQSCGSTPLPVTAYEYAVRDGIDALRLENDALRAQIAGHSSQMQDMDRKMSAVLAQLEALGTSSQRLRFSTNAVR